VPLEPHLVAITSTERCERRLLRKLCYMRKGARNVTTRCVSMVLDAQASKRCGSTDLVPIHMATTVVGGCPPLPNECTLGFVHELDRLL
jgi:hypothetical protein